jgi:hypothetical protein
MLLPRGTPRFCLPTEPGVLTIGCERSTSTHRYAHTSRKCLPPVAGGVASGDGGWIALITCDQAACWASFASCACLACNAAAACFSLAVASCVTLWGATEAALPPPIGMIDTLSSCLIIRYWADMSQTCSLGYNESKVAPSQGFDLERFALASFPLC